MKKKPNHIKQEDWDAVESPPLSNKMLSKMQPVRKSHPNMPSRVRGPQKERAGVTSWGWSQGWGHILNSEL